VSAKAREDQVMASILQNCLIVFWESIYWIFYMVWWGRKRGNRLLGRQL